MLCAMNNASDDRSCKNSQKNKLSIEKSKNKVVSKSVHSKNFWFTLISFEDHEYDLF